MLANLLPSTTPLVSEYFSFLMLLSVVSGIGLFYKSHNCHHHLCPRISWHTDKSGHPVCKHHHPDHPKRSRLQDKLDRWLIKRGWKKPLVSVAPEQPPA